MLKNRSITGISLLIPALVALVILIIVYSTESQSRSISESVIERKLNEVNVLASRATLRLSDAKTIMTITGSLPQITSRPDTILVNKSINGVPQNVGTEKRFVASTILKEYPQFETVSFLLSNGDVYFVEPFDKQKNITLKNFAFRDYFEGVVANNRPYLSQIIRSNATGHTVSALAVPVHDKINGSFIGIWVGALNLMDMSKAIQELSPKNEIVSYIDQRGHEVVSNNDRGLLKTTHGNDTFVHEKIEGFKNAMAGESGYTVERLNGIKMFVAYAPIKAISTTWTVLSFEPYNNAFYSANSLRLNGIIMSIILGAAAAVIVILLNRSFRSINRLTKEIIEKDKDLHKYNEELLAVERAKEEFMSMINHELKTPLVPIKGYADMLLKPNIMGSLNEKQKKAVSSISYNVGKLELLVSDILDVYKLDMGKLSISRKDVADQKNVEIKSDIQYNGPVYCDQRRIDQVITNLIKNSIDFVPANTGKIILRVSKKENKIIFSVEDNGSGIPPDKVDNLFKKFYQIDTTMTRKHGGTGLGLAISKGIVEAHGGTMWVDKEYLGGARFIFTLPVKEESI